MVKTVAIIIDVPAIEIIDGMGLRSTGGLFSAGSSVLSHRLLPAAHLNLAGHHHQRRIRGTS